MKKPKKRVTKHSQTTEQYAADVRRTIAKEVVKNITAKREVAKKKLAKRKIHKSKTKKQTPAQLARRHEWARKRNFEARLETLMQSFVRNAEARLLEINRVLEKVYTELSRAAQIMATPLVHDHSRAESYEILKGNKRYG